MDDELLSFEVLLPEHSNSQYRSTRRGRICISTEQYGDELLEVPLAVGRSLKAALDKGRTEPSVRSELLAWIGEVSLTCGHSRVETLLSRRDYSSQELSRKLIDDGYSPDIVKTLVNRACSSGLVNDTRYADSFIRTKLSAGWGKDKIERELSRKGIDAEQIEGWPDEYLSEGAERERAFELALSRPLTGKNDYARLVRFLCGRGFSYGLAADVAQEVLENTCQ